MLRRNTILAVTLAAALAALSTAASAQSRTGPATQSGDQSTPTATSMFGKNLTSEDIGKLSDYVENSKLAKSKGELPGQAKRDPVLDKARVEAAVKTLQLSCDVADMAPLGDASTTTDGKTLNTHTYEVACGNGLGYFLVSLDPGLPQAYSCFAAEGARAADAAKGKTDDVACTLPANANANAAATIILTHAGTPCTVNKLSWLGQSNTTGLEYTEMACSDGKGYVLATSIPGTPAQLRVTSCADEAAQGLQCTLTKGAPVANVLTVQTFKDALAQHGVQCEATNVRVAGQENVKKRYVVEFQCPQKPNGLVAFIPLSGNTNKFETMDCAGAAKVGLACKLTAKN
jgi:hypothetical protein